MAGTRYSYHFRGAAGSTWTETAPSAYVLPGDVLPAKNADGTYPATRNGLIFGWSAAPSSSASITTSPANARTSGRHLTNTLGTKFYIDLPEGPGTYKLWCSLSALNSATATAMDIYLADGQGGAAGTLLTGLGFSTSHTPASGSNVDAAGTVDTIANWVTNDVSVNITIPTGVRGIWLSKTAGQQLYINSIDLQAQTSALVDCNLSKEDGTGTATSVYSGEPAGKKIGRITAVAGEQVFSVVLGASYYAVATIRGEQWLVTTTTRIPDSFNGIVTLRQTSALWGTRDTTFTLSVTPTAGRPVDGSIEGQLTSETWLLRKWIKDTVTAARSARWLDTAPFVADAANIDLGTVASTAQLYTLYNGLTPDGTSRYRVRLQNGTYPTGVTTFPWKNFGSGSLLIEPDVGHDPVVLSDWFFQGVNGLEIRYTRFNPAFNDYSIHVAVTSNAPGNAVNIHHNRLGALHVAGNTRAGWSSWGTFAWVEQARECWVEYNDVYGLKNLIIPSACYAMQIAWNECRELQVDFSRPSPFYRHNTPLGIHPDNDTHFVTTGNLIHQSSIKDPASGASHPDFCQEARFMGSCYSYLPRPNGNPSATWSVGDYTINMSEMKIYACTVPGVGAPGQPPATGALTTGTATFAYFADYNAMFKMYGLVEGNGIKVDGQEYVDVGGNRNLNGRQTFINSNDGIGQDPVMVFFQNVSLSPSSYGLNGGSGGTIHAEYNRLLGPNEVPPAGGKSIVINDTSIYAGTKVRARRNILGKQASAPYPNISGPSVYDDENLPITWSGTGQYAPNSNLRGNWTQNADGTWNCPIADISGDIAAMFSNISKATHHIGDTVGGALREVHTVTLTDAVGKTGTFDIVVDPQQTFYPVADWRAVAIDVTALDGTTSIPAILAQQASVATKSRGAGVSIAGTGVENGVIFKLPAHTEPYVATFTGHSGFITSAAIDYSVDNGANWLSAGYAIQTITAGNNAGSAGRRQMAKIPAGVAKWVRFRATSSSPFTLKPLIHRMPSVGFPPVMSLHGNSLVYFPWADDAGEAALMARFPNIDPLMINWAQASANAANITASVDTLTAQYPSGIISSILTQGVLGTVVNGSRPYVSGQLAGITASLNTFYAKIDSLNLRHIPLADTYRPYDVVGGPNYVAGKAGSPTNQGATVLPYNTNAQDPQILARYPAYWDASLLRPKADVYLKYLKLRALIADGTHLASYAEILDWYASTPLRYWITGDFGASEVEQRIAAVESSALQSDYDDVSYALLAVDAAAPGKAAIQARLTATIPAVKYLNASIAVAAVLPLLTVAEASLVQSDKDAAQAAIDAAQVTINDAVAAGSPSTTSLQTTLDGYQTRVNAIVVVTVTQRAKINYGQASLPSGYGASLNSNATVAINNTAGAATGWSVTHGGHLSSSTVNGLSTALGSAPNDHAASAMQSYEAATSTFTEAFTGLDPAKLYRFYIASATNSVGTKNVKWAVTVGNNAPSPSPAEINPSNTAVQQIIDMVQPTAGGAITLTATRGTGNASFIFLNSIIIEEIA